MRATVRATNEGHYLSVAHAYCHVSGADPANNLTVAFGKQF